MAHESKKLVLPDILVGKPDVMRVRRELEALQDYLHQAALRKQDPADIKLPKTSRLLDELAAANRLNLLHRADHEQLMHELELLQDSAPTLHMSFSAEPSGAFLAKLMTWLRQNIAPNILVQVGLQPSIAAGCIVRTPNHQYDLSMAQSFKKHSELLFEKLHEGKPA